MPRSAIAQAGHWGPSKWRTLPAHRNAGLEIVLLSRGQLRWHIEGRVEHLGPGSVFFTLPWETHGGVEEREPGCVLHYVVIRLDRTYAKPNRDFAWHPAVGLSSSATRRLRQRLLAAPQRCWPATPALSRILPALVAEHGEHAASPDALHAWARLALIELGRSLDTHTQAHPVQPPAEQRVRQFLDQLERQCHQHWTLGTMADACDLGRTQFANILHRFTGDRPIMALHRARIRRAQQMLATTDRPITQIALDCGFASSQHFASVFRDYVGQTARAYRQRGDKTHATVRRPAGARVSQR